jgi:hypothetical protein
MFDAISAFWNGYFNIVNQALDFPIRWSETVIEGQNKLAQTFAQTLTEPLQDTCNALAACASSKGMMSLLGTPMKIVNAHVEATKTVREEVKREANVSQLINSFFNEARNMWLPKE